MLGTAAYLAPEQGRGEEAGPPADIYALGVVAYQLLSGRLPFEGASLSELAHKQQNELPARLDTPRRRRHARARERDRGRDADRTTTALSNRAPDGAERIEEGAAGIRPGAGSARHSAARRSAGAAELGHVRAPPSGAGTSGITRVAAATARPRAPAPAAPGGLAARGCPRRARRAAPRSASATRTRRLVAAAVLVGARSPPRLSRSASPTGRFEDHPATASSKRADGRRPAVDALRPEHALRQAAPGASAGAASGVACDSPRPGTPRAARGWSAAPRRPAPPNPTSPASEQATAAAAQRLRQLRERAVDRSPQLAHHARHEPSGCAASAAARPVSSPPRTRWCR